VETLDSAVGCMSGAGYEAAPMAPRRGSVEGIAGLTRRRGDGGGAGAPQGSWGEMAAQDEDAATARREDAKAAMR
jgi:hypothetical protein